jgi:periplasmic divalent cation tolerance protein
MIIVLTTVAKKADALKLAKKLVDKRMAACVNIIKLEKSVYRWKGKVEMAGEYLLLIKSTAQKHSKIEEFIKKNHPYTLPEIVILDTSGASKEYLKWVRGCC